MDHEPVHHINEAAKLLGSSRSVIYAWAARGMIDIRKIGNRAVIFDSEIRRLRENAPPADVRRKTI